MESEQNPTVLSAEPLQAGWALATRLAVAWVISRNISARWSLSDTEQLQRCSPIYSTSPAILQRLCTRTSLKTLLLVKHVGCAVRWVCVNTLYSKQCDTQSTDCIKHLILWHNVGFHYILKQINQTSYVRKCMIATKKVTNQKRNSWQSK